MIVGAVQKLKEEIQVLQGRIAAIQSKCSHPEEALERTPHSNTDCDNYTRYWATFHCHLCDHRWSEDQ